MFVFSNFTSLPVGVREYCDQSVCMSVVCLFGYLKNHTSKFTVHVTCDRGSVLL